MYEKEKETMMKQEGRCPFFPNDNLNLDQDKYVWHILLNNFNTEFLFYYR